MRYDNTPNLFLVLFLVAEIDIPANFGDLSPAPILAAPTAAVLGILIGGAA